MKKYEKVVYTHLEYHRISTNLTRVKRLEKSRVACVEVGFC